MSKVHFRQQETFARFPWPLVVIAVGATLVLFIWFLAWRGGNSNTATAPGTEGARLATDREVIDFGAVKYNVPVQATFRLRNTGDAPLRVMGEPRVELVQGC